MSKVLTDDANFTAIGNAIRSKNGESTLYKPGEMAEAIQDIESYPEPSGTQLITENGIVSVKDKEFADVNVQAELGPGDEGKVVVEGELVAQGSQTITQNGTYDTTLISELIANISGGGGSTNILSGVDDPTTSLGSDGDVYLQYVAPNNYIESSGDVYVDTGYAYTNKTSVELVARSYNDRTNSYQILFGARETGGSSNQLLASVRDNNTWRFRAMRTSTFAWTPFPYGEKVKVEIGVNNATLTNLTDGTTHSGSVGSASNGTRPIVLFSMREGNSITGHYSHYRLYEFSVYEEDELTLHLIPSLDSNDDPCLNDTLTGDYYYGSGTGELIFAQDETLVEKAYCKVNGTWQDLIFTDINDVNTGG